jgi:AAA+ ATPase superfamily predicted ATPase
VEEGGARLLRSLDKNTNANLLFIFGNARSGKSFLMNCLVGVPGLFKVLHRSTVDLRFTSVLHFTNEMAT